MTGKNKNVLSLRTEISELMAKCTIVSFLQKVKARAIETVSDLKKASETSAVSGSHEKTLIEKVSSLMDEFLSVRVERDNFRVELDAKTTVVQRMKKDVRNLLSNVFTKAQMTYHNTGQPFNQKNQKNVVNG